jgi:hypothetical protein
MHRDTFDLASLPPEYLDDALRDLDSHEQVPPWFDRWNRIPLDLMPIRCRVEVPPGSDCGIFVFYVLPHELAYVLCVAIRGDDCGCDDEPFARWLKCRIALRRHVMGIKP